jgi:hypothetical protein
MKQAGWLVYRAMMNRNPGLVKDRQYKGAHKIFRQTMVGTEMVDWLLEVGGSTVLSRHLAAAMWQAFLEEGVIVHGKILYRHTVFRTNFEGYCIFLSYTPQQQWNTRSKTSTCSINGR